MAQLPNKPDFLSVPKDHIAGPLPGRVAKEVHSTKAHGDHTNGFGQSRFRQKPCPGRGYRTGQPRPCVSSRGIVEDCIRKFSENLRRLPKIRHWTSSVRKRHAGIMMPIGYRKLTPERRQRFLQKLHSTIRGIPSRHALFVLGDVNSTCMPQGNICGKWVMPSPARQQDNEDLMAILSAFALTALNSWHRPSHGQLATFTFGELASQIDYIFCRQCHARSRAKHAEVLPQFPVACWRDGAKHHPVLAQVTVPYNKWQPPASQCGPAHP